MFIFFKKKIHPYKNAYIDLFKQINISIYTYLFPLQL